MLPQMSPLPWLWVAFMMAYVLFSFTLIMKPWTQDIKITLKQVKKDKNSLPW